MDGGGLRTLTVASVFGGPGQILWTTSKSKSLSLDALCAVVNDYGRFADSLEELARPSLARLDSGLDTSAPEMIERDVVAFSQVRPLPACSWALNFTDPRKPPSCP